MGLYERIRDLAKLKGYSINRLEKELGFARSSINKFNTNTPSVDKIRQIADFLDVSVDAITGEEKEGGEAKSTPGVNIVNKNGVVQSFDMNSIVYSIMESVSKMPPEQQELVNNMVGGKKKVFFVGNPQNRITHTELNAAHGRTDINIPNEIDTSDNDIMDDENF